MTLPIPRRKTGRLPNPTPEDFRRLRALLALMQAGKGVAPSFRELAAAWGTASTGSARRWLHRLQSFGLIRVFPNRARAIAITRHLVPVAVGGRDPVMLPATLNPRGYPR